MNRRSARAILPAFLILCMAAAPVAAEEEPAPEWRETTRDVYVDGTLDPGAIVLRAGDPPRIAVLRSRGDTSPIVIDTESLTLVRTSLEELTLGERGWEARTRGKARAVTRGEARQIDDATLLVKLPEGFLLVTRHAGTPGPSSRDEIFAQVPTWKALYDRYEPDAATVQALGSTAGDVELTLALGTWCGDSKREVPRLLKALDLAGNPKLTLNTVALSGDFEDPEGLLLSRRLTNVPTLIVSRGGEEIGRIVETPAGESMADDLAQILGGTPRSHPGRWSRTDRLARGRFTLRDAAGRERGVEDWELFSDADGGRLLHAWSDLDGKATEVWHRRDAEGRSSFIEVTGTEGSWHRRSRHWIEDGALSALTRGNGTGIIRQNARLDDGAVVVSPCFADLGPAASRAAASQGPTTRSAVLLGGSGQPPVGRLGTLELSRRGTDSITTAAGTFEATRIAGRFDGTFADAWLHPDLGIPIRWRNANGDEATLTALRTYPPTTDPPH